MGVGDLPLFSGMSPPALDPLLARLSPVRIAPGDVLMSEGDSSDFFAIVVSGEATVERTRPAGLQALGSVKPGDVVGELGLLRSRPRGASVTAVTALEAVVGDAETFHVLLDLPGVHDQLQRVVSRRVAENLTPVVMALAGREETVAFRPLLPSDREALYQGVREASAETLRRRFFTAGVPKTVLDYLIDVDFVDHFAWVCVDEHGTGIGISRYIRSEERSEEAEFAFVVADPWQGCGIGTLLLGAIAVAAGAAEIDTLTATFLQDNEGVRAILRKVGASFDLVEPGVSCGAFSTAAAEQLLNDRYAAALRAAVSDVVSAAGLACA